MSSLFTHSNGCISNNYWRIVAFLLTDIDLWEQGKPNAKRWMENQMHLVFIILDCLMGEGDTLKKALEMAFFFFFYFVFLFAVEVELVK